MFEDSDFLVIDKPFDLQVDGSRPLTLEKMIREVRPVPRPHINANAHVHAHTRRHAHAQIHKKVSFFPFCAGSNGLSALRRKARYDWYTSSTIQRPGSFASLKPSGVPLQRPSPSKSAWQERRT